MWKICNGLFLRAVASKEGEPILEERELVRHAITHRLLLVEQQAGVETVHVVDAAAAESLGLQSKRVEVDLQEAHKAGAPAPGWVEECRAFVSKAALEASGAVLVEGDPTAACSGVLACLLLLPALRRRAQEGDDAAAASATSEKKQKSKKGEKEGGEKTEDPEALTYDAALQLLQRRCEAPPPPVPAGIELALQSVADGGGSGAELSQQQTQQPPVSKPKGRLSSPASSLSVPEPSAPVLSLSKSGQFDSLQAPASSSSSSSSQQKQRTFRFSGVFATFRRRSGTNRSTEKNADGSTSSWPSLRGFKSRSNDHIPDGGAGDLDAADSPEESDPHHGSSRSSTGPSSPAPHRNGPPRGGTVLSSSVGAPLSAAPWYPMASSAAGSEAGGRGEPLAWVRRNRDKNEKPDPSDRIYKLGDLPRDVRSQVLATKIPFDDLERHFDIVLNILYFNKKVELPRRPRQLITPAGEGAAPAEEEVGQEVPAGPKYAPKTEEELLNTTINPKKAFKFVCMSGQGGYGKVWTAKSDVPEFKGKVAVKRLQHVDPKEKKHNVLEMSFLSFCKHPNIVTYYTSILLKNELMIVMEFMEGGTLTEATKGHNFTELQIAYVARELLSALCYLHDNKLAHRDLKSGNIMMTIKGQIKLIDFGLCVDVAPGPRNDMVGSPFWMAPEMVARQPHSTPVDIWSFAISLLELANKDPPHRKSSIKCMFTFGTVGCPDPLNEPAKWSPSFKDFLAQCLQVDPAQRATARQLLRHPFVLKTAAQKQMASLINQIFMQTSIAQIVIT